MLKFFMYRKHPIRFILNFELEKIFGIKLRNFIPIWPSNKAESTKQMEQTRRAKVKIFFKSENFKKWF